MINWRSICPECLRITAARYKEDISWMAVHLEVPFLVYQAEDAELKPNHFIAHTHSNLAREGSAFLTFIAEYYDCLPEVKETSQYFSWTFLSCRAQHRCWLEIVQMPTVIHATFTQWVLLHVSSPEIHREWSGKEVLTEVTCRPRRLSMHTEAAGTLKTS